MCNLAVSNIIQSCNWKEKCSTNPEKTYIPYLLYCEDFECGNPLGSHAGAQSVAATYCQFTCIPPEFCSLLENIFAVMLHSSSFKSLGNSIIFQELIRELKYLDQEGILVKNPEL